MTSTAADEAPAAEAAIQSAATTAGAALRRARESRGLHIAALAATLKVPQSKLEALEADRYQDLPDATFARALARSMCRALKVDAEPVLAMLPRSGGEASLDRVTPGLNQPFRERAASQEPMIGAGLLKSPVVLGVVALLVAAAAVYLVPSSWVEQVTQRLQGTSTDSTAASTSTATPDASTEVPVSEAPMASAPVLTAAPGAEASAPVTVPTATAPAATVPASTPAVIAAATPAPTTSATPTPAPAGTAPLRVKVTAESWVEVVDAQGQVQLSRLLRPGEQVDVNGVAPLKLRVGNVSGTELVFRGQPVDLAARSRDNVARLELN